MSRVALWVVLTPKPGRAAELRERAVRHARTCLAEEDGCERFDVLAGDDGGATLALYEVYRDEAALQAHDASAHMALYRRDTAELIAARQRSRYQVQE